MRKLIAVSFVALAASLLARGPSGAGIAATGVTVTETNVAP